MENKVKFECGDCGCYFWVEDRNNFNCPCCKITKCLECGFEFGDHRDLNEFEHECWPLKEEIRRKLDSGEWSWEAKNIISIDGTNIIMEITEE